MLPPDNGSVYAGGAWRSRFLRAPKVGLRLAARPDFAPIGDLATVSLGLKTGADKFFFPARAAAPDRPGELSVTERGVHVTGYEDWRGQLNSRDILPALVGPHELFEGDRRRFLVPKKTSRFYLYPEGSRLRSGLKSYVRLGEIAGVNSQSLVKQNASQDWWRQVRPLVRDAWALPYNSAYDYGAWDNATGAVLNGRFVGASAKDGIASDLLGAALNSTFAVVGRLLEGMATGTEGAFDVGPPAVRLIRVPDVRMFNEDGKSSVLEVMALMRKQDTMPPGPKADGTVSPLRRQLDGALLEGLGLTAGRAASILDELYSSYGRWRRDVEEVEQQMQQHRRQMSRSGQARSARPTDVAGRRVWEELSPTARLFPCSLLTLGDEVESIRVPKGAPLSIHEPLFDAGLITNGIESVDLKQHSRVRYVAMLRKIGFDGELLVLVDPAKAGAIVDRFDKHERELRVEAAQRALSYLGRDAAAEAVEVAISFWFKACREAGMVLPPKDGDGEALQGVAREAPTTLH